MAKRFSEKATLPFDRRNWKLFFLGLGVILIGYVFLSIPPAEGIFSLSLAPILLVAGYCVLIPVAILLHGRQKTETEKSKNRNSN